MTYRFSRQSRAPLPPPQTVLLVVLLMGLVVVAVVFLSQAQNSPSGFSLNVPHPENTLVNNEHVSY